MPTYLDGETKTDRTLGDVDTDVAAIRAVTDLLPDGGALTDLAAIKAVTDLLPDAGALTVIAHDTSENEHHIHSPLRWWGALGAPGEGNAIEANVSRPFVAVSGNDDWGVVIPICGAADVPSLATDTMFDVHEILVVDTDHATPYRLRLIYGTGTSAAAIGAGQWTELMFITATGPFAAGATVIIRMPSLDVGTKLWAQVWNATNASEVDFFWNAHGH